MKPAHQRALAAVLANLAALDELPVALDRCATYARDGYPDTPTGTGEHTSTSSISDPTAAQALKPDRYADELRNAEDALWRAAHAMRTLAGFVDRMRPIELMADQPDDPCGNLACNHVCTGQGNDRIRRPRGLDVGLCRRCYRHWQAHGGLWPKDANGRVVPTARELVP